VQFNQAIDLLKRPKYAEGTKLASSRDDRNNAFLWKKGELNSGQIYSLAQAIEKATREIAKQRRKPLGGGSIISSQIQVFKIDVGAYAIDFYPDYLDTLSCTNMTTLESGIIIAKQPSCWASVLTDQMNAITVSYVYYSPSSRTISPFPDGGSSTISQILSPSYNEGANPNSFLLAMPVPEGFFATINPALDLLGVQWIEISPARSWINLSYP
jgi:hypothetical protein